MKKVTVVLFTSIFSLLIINGCSTVAGVGADLQKVGGIIKDKANKNKTKSE